MSLDPTQEMFNNKTLNYDLEKYPLPGIVLKTIQKFYPDVKSLETIHEVVKPEDIQQLMSNTSQELLKTDFYDHFDHLVQDHVVKKLNKEVLIQKFGNLRILIPNQEKTGAVLLFHQGRWVGNGLGLRTVWTPLTDCYDSNSMQILHLEDSREITRKSVKESWTYEKLQEECVSKCWPVTLSPGQAHLFFQEHIHGNIPNKTDKTRVSIDIRILLKDGQPHRKWPGSYFRKLLDRDYNRDVKILPNQSVLTYGEYEGIKTKYIDLHFQTLTVKDYCRRKGYKYPYQHGENEGLHNSHLDYLIRSKSADHILLFSIFSMPNDSDKRKAMMELALDRRVCLHFCNEDLVLETKEDLDKIEYLRSFTDDWSSPVDQLIKELR